MIYETINNNRNNTFTVQYGGIVFPTATRIDFILNGTTVSSTTNPEYFDLTQFTASGIIEFNLGSAGFIADDSGNATVVIYDAVNTLGVEYSNECNLKNLFVSVC